ncbi:hypothetical protein MNB_SUP05-SYMBIONT-5-1258 [hydrothermal vent metagenome]|uniref:Uncharacterized protein n=1 Tax=hydrothermal vent metagenome TaxID=652676 RepID=A0A1W1E101_9ZZZZ
MYSLNRTGISADALKFVWLVKGLVGFGVFHSMGKTVFWLKSLHQLGFMRFFSFYFLD